jgi:ribosomal-protein-alanine N-acetyltransferase
MTHEETDASGKSRLSANERLDGSVFLKGDRVFLKTIEKADLNYLRDNTNSPVIRRAMVSDGPTDTEQLRAKLDEDADYQFVIAIPGTRVGYISLHDIDSANVAGVLSYWVSPDHQEHGYMTEGIELLVNYAFQQLRLHKVRADIREFNEASRRVLEKIGFTHEGVLRESRFVDGEYWDRHRYGLLDYEWMKPSTDVTKDSAE